jgi:pyruvate formate lyase activating enzyme
VAYGGGDYDFYLTYNVSGGKMESTTSGIPINLQVSHSKINISGGELYTGATSNKCEVIRTTKMTAGRGITISGGSLYHRGITGEGDMYGCIIGVRGIFAEGAGVTVTGGEPLLQIDFVTELFTLLKEKGIHTCVDTSGIAFKKENAVSVEKHEKLLEVTDLFLLDIKHIDSEGHKALTGQDNANTLAFAKFLSERKKSTWIRHVLVPGITDDDEQLQKLKQFVDGLSSVEKIEVLPYHTLGVVKYEKLGMEYPLKDVSAPDKERVLNAKRILGVIEE